MLIKSLTLVFAAIIFLSCNSGDMDKKPTSSEPSEVTKKPDVIVNEKSTSFQDFTNLFKDSLNHIKLTAELVNSPDFIALSDVIINDWIIYDTYAVTGNSLREENDKWIPIGIHVNDTVTTVCVVQLCKATSAYLFQYNTKRDYFMYMHQIGYISLFGYKDSSEEAGESYDFDITECESLNIEIKNNHIYTTCERYTATVGKDWRIDQNLYVNDTVKLPVMEDLYSLY